MRPNKIKQIWHAGQCATLGWLSVSHGFTAEVMARQGFDALCVDLQHGTAEMKDVLPMLQAISQTDTVPVVRVAWWKSSPTSGISCPEAVVTLCLRISSARPPNFPAARRCRRAAGQRSSAPFSKPSTAESFNMHNEIGPVVLGVLSALFAAYGIRAARFNHHSSNPDYSCPARGSVSSRSLGYLNGK